MRKQRSPIRFVQTSIDVKFWIENLPSVEAVRPAQCPCCGVASRAPGDKLMLHGHGLRARTIRGPLAAGAAPREVEITLRRYRCQPCGAVIAVGPAGIVFGRLYSAPAIGLALFLYGVEQVSHPTVRHQVSPWRPSARDPTRTCWVTLVRWIEARRRGQLFGHLRSKQLPQLSRRAVAADTARMLSDLSFAALASEKERVFAGAARVG